MCTTHTYTNSSMRSQIYLLPSHVHSVSVCVCVCFIYPNSHGVLICNVCGSLNQISIQFPFNAHAIYGPRRTGWCPIEALPRRVEKKSYYTIRYSKRFPVLSWWSRCRKKLHTPGYIRKPHLAGSCSLGQSLMLCIAWPYQYCSCVFVSNMVFIIRCMSIRETFAH